MKFFLIIDILMPLNAPTRLLKNKGIDFARCNKSIMTNKHLSINLEQFLRRIKSPLTH